MYKITLKAMGNPDRGQDPDEPMYGVESCTLVVQDHEDLKRLVRRWQVENGVGAGNWVDAPVYSDGAFVGLMAYNGRFMQPAALQDYVRAANEWNVVFNRPTYDLHNPEHRKAIARRIDSELSPENLTCDGELPRTEVNRRYNQLIRVAQQLREVDPSIQFSEV